MSLHLLQTARPSFKLSLAPGFSSHWFLPFYQCPSPRLSAPGSPRMLQPVLVDEIMRVEGRLDKVLIPFEAKNQVILPLAYHLSRLLVRDLENHLHVGRKQTLALACQKFWTSEGTSFVRKIINDCLHCSRRRAKSNEPMMGSLPKERHTLWASIHKHWCWLFWSY